MHIACSVQCGALFIVYCPPDSFYWLRSLLLGRKAAGTDIWYKSFVPVVPFGRHAAPLCLVWPSAYCNAHTAYAHTHPFATHVCVCGHTHGRWGLGSRTWSGRIRCHTVGAHRCRLWDINASVAWSLQGCAVLILQSRRAVKFLPGNLHTGKFISRPLPVWKHLQRAGP